VVTINGVVASLAATEAIVHLTGLRPSAKQLTYRADQGGVRIYLDSPSYQPGLLCALEDCVILPPLLSRSPRWSEGSPTQLSASAARTSNTSAAAPSTYHLRSVDPPMRCSEPTGDLLAPTGQDSGRLDAGAQSAGCSNGELHLRFLRERFTTGRLVRPL
jgi:hypothetical protein